MATIFKLIIEDDEGKTTVYPLADGRLTIGRKDGNTIRLMERNVSRRHARLERTNGAVFIEDLDSYNGVKINGERISGKYEVKEGDLVEIGDYHLALQKSVTRSEAPEPASDGGGFDDADEGTWPQPGTVPDFQLPDELLIEARDDGAVRDTVIDQPVPPQVPNVVNQTVDERPKPVPVGPESQSSLPTSADEDPNTAPPGAGYAGDEEGEPERTPTDLRPGPDVISDVPRLVCVSTTYAGRAFALTRPELIIGRVEDNDIVIEHRSVSRNHAKILFDGRTHKIIDLQSANGILVNGEEYAMTDLRKGDLIELGHVRFRFVPADEPFHVTAEEGQQMRSAGVCPPPFGDADPDEPLESRPTEPPTYDPSQAATVTDAPLSALETSPPEPRVEAQALNTTPLAAPHPQPSGANGAPRTGSGPQVAARSLRTTENDRPTELPRPQPAAGAVVGVEPPVPLARPASMVEDAALSRPRKKRTLPMMAAIALLAVSVFAAVVLLFDSLQGDDSADRALQGLVEQKRYEDAAAHCDRHQGRFVDPGEAQRLCSAARNFLRAAAVAADPIEPFPEPDIEPPVAPALEPVEAAATAESVPEPEIEEPPSLAPPPSPPTQPSAAVVARRRRAAARRAAARKAAAIRTLVERGKRLVINGDFAQAEKTLRECLRLEPNQPDCHRNLGVLYAQQDQTASAIRHYRRYVELRPDAGDAARVREILRKFEGSP